MPQPFNIPPALRWAAAAVVATAAALVVLATQPVAVQVTALAPPVLAPFSAAPRPGATAATDAAASTLPAGQPLSPAAPPWPATGWLAPPAAEAHALPTLTLAELREVQAALAAAPQAGTEHTASAEAMFFADVARRFHEVLGTGQQAEPGELKALAQMLDHTLDTRLQRGDLPWADARLVKTAVLGALRPADAAIAEQVEDWEIRLRQGPLRPTARAGHPPREGHLPAARP